MKSKKYLSLFAIGGVLYCALEILWRGYTHWSMALAGGICLCGIFAIDKLLSNNTLFFKGLVCALMITTVEFTVGIIVNLCLDMSVWDYSERRFNILGQVCPLYTLIWFALSIPALKLCKIIDKNFLKV